MKKLIISTLAIALFATTIISCQSNQKGTTEGGVDSVTIAARADSAEKAKSTAAAESRGDDLINVSPNIKVKTPQFSNEDVNSGFEKFDPIKQEYADAINSGDAAKIKEATAKYNNWVKDAATWGSKLTPDENQLYIDHYTKLVAQWDKLSLKVKK